MLLERPSEQIEVVHQLIADKRQPDEAFSASVAEPRAEERTAHVQLGQRAFLPPKQRLPNQLVSLHAQNQPDAEGLRAGAVGKVQRVILVFDPLRKPLPGGTCRWRNPARWWGAGSGREPMEIDVVAESPSGDALLVGEAKLALTADEARHELAELKAKARLLPFAAKYRRMETRLFVAEGGDFDCVDLSWCE